MDKLQILQYKLSPKQRLLKLKRTQSFQLLLGLIGLGTLFISICYQPRIKDQYYKISIAIMRLAEKPLLHWHEMQNAFLTVNQLTSIKLKKEQYQNKLLQDQLTALRHENDLLKKEIHYQSRDFENFISTPVIGAQFAARKQYMFASVGTQHGVKLACPVLVRGMIIGMVDHVAASTCRISLISSHLSRIPVYVVHPEQHGIVTGNNDNLLRLELRDNYNKCKHNDAVYTSGLGGIYPAHKLIGRVADVTDQFIIIDPAQTVKSTDIAQIIVPLEKILPT